MIWTIALNVWLLIVGATWLNWITAPPKFLGAAALVVVLIFIIELIYTHREDWGKRF